MKVNPFMKDLKGAKYERDALEKHFSELGYILFKSLRREAVYAFLARNNMTEAQEKVQELFYLWEAIEFMISDWEQLLKIPIPESESYSPNFKADYRRIDIYYCLILHALRYATELRENPRVDLPHSDSMIVTELRENARVDLLHSDSMIVANLSRYFEATDFMILLINKVLEEEDIMEPSLAHKKRFQEAQTLVTKCIHRYENETIATFICLVVNGEYEEAEVLFKSLLKHMKPSDIINRGRVYNYALQKAQELLKVYTFLSSPSLSQRYKDVVQCNNRLNGLAMEYNNQVQVQRFLVILYLTDHVDLKQAIDWEFVEQHDFPYLITCVRECHKRIMVVPNDFEHDNYVFTSSAAIVGGQDIMKHLLEARPTLDVNASYKGVAALHVAALKGNGEVIKFLLKQEGLDINLRSERLLTADGVKKFLEYCKPALDVTALNKGVMDCTRVPASHATVLKDHEEVIKDLLLLQEIEISSEGNLDAQEFTKRIGISGKKWNKNRWKLPTYQTALHIAVTQGHAKAVQLLCDAPEPHQQRLRCHEEDEEGRTPLDILLGRRNEVAVKFDITEIEKILSGKQDVQKGIDRLYRNRQVLVDAVNTILVGAALIASVTFAGWLQPPLGHASYYDLAVPPPAPPGTYDSYFAVQGNLGMKAFALFNSLSFFFAIATVIVGADAAFPQPTNKFIGHVVQEMHLLLRRAIKFLVISLVCVLGAFGSAAIVVLPPSLFFRKDLVLSIVVGGGVCGYAMWQLLLRHSERVHRLNASIRHIIKFTNMF